MNSLYGLRRYAAPVLSLALIAGIWAEWRALHLPVGDAEGYHAAVRATVGRLPERIGDWAGVAVNPPPSAVDLLKPNVLLGREFRNAVTGEHATFVLIQCRDARDMGGHWPPVCYPAQGWTLKDTQQRSLAVQTRVVPVTTYRFTMASLNRYDELVVYSFFLRPDGVLEGGREGLRRLADDPRLKVYGAGQIQLIVESSVDPDRRDEIFRILVAAAAPIVDAVLGGVVR